MPEQLKALSVRQPWAEQIIRGEKAVEYRRQSVNFRGRIYIYASQGRADDGDAIEATTEMGVSLDDLPRGVVVGTVEIADCESDGSGGYEWQLANPQRLPEPLVPQQQPMQVWFYPFGNPEDQSLLSSVKVDGSESLSAGSSSQTTTLFAPVIANAEKPPFTPYHSKYLAYELTRRVGADKAEKLAQSLSNATVDLNPHQVDAALFAFRSPLSRGAALRLALLTLSLPRRLFPLSAPKPPRLVPPIAGQCWCANTYPGPVPSAAGAC